MARSPRDTSARRQGDVARWAVPETEREVFGRRYIRLLENQLASLRASPVHGNREVFLDHLVIAHLLAFFNPGVRGLRSVEDVFDIPGVRQRYGVRRLPKSTVADAQRVFDPQLLRPLLDSLIKRARLVPHDPRLDDVTRRLLAVDGSFFTVAPRIAWALYNKSCKAGRNLNKGHVRAHIQFDILHGIPVEADLTDGQAAEWRQLRQRLQPDRFYVMDRGFQAYELLADIVGVGSDFLVRLRKSANAHVVEQYPLTVADQANGITGDALVQIGWREDQTPTLPNLRRVEVAYTDRDGKAGVLLLLTSRIELPAWMIALIYQHRWQVELFFRWLKCVAHFDHFFSESRDGMTLQLYVTLIALLLIAVETGAKPSKYDFALLSFAINSGEPIEDVLAVAAKRRAERARAAAWQRQYNAKKAAQKAGH